MCVLGWIVKSESLYNVLVCMHLQAGVCVCVWMGVCLFVGFVCVWGGGRKAGVRVDLSYLLFGCAI